MGGAMGEGSAMRVRGKSHIYTDDHFDRDDHDRDAYYDDISPVYYDLPKYGRHHHGDGQRIHDHDYCPSCGRLSRKGL